MLKYLPFSNINCIFVLDKLQDRKKAYSLSSKQMNKLFIKYVNRLFILMLFYQLVYQLFGRLYEDYL